MKKFVILKINQELIEEIIYETLFDKISECFPDSESDSYAEIISPEEGGQPYAFGLGVADENLGIDFGFKNELGNIENLQNFVVKSMNEDNFAYIKIDLQTMLSYIQKHFQKIRIKNFSRKRYISSIKFFGTYDKDFRCVAVIYHKPPKNELDVETADELSDFSIGNYNELIPKLKQSTFNT